MNRPVLAARALALAAVFLVGGAPSVLAGSPPRNEPRLTDAGIAEVKAALDEHRYVDAAGMLDQATLSGVKDARLGLLLGDLEIIRGHYAKALADYRGAQGVPDQRGWALRGEGMALSALGRSDEALKVLKAAVAADPAAWQAWNALGIEYDGRGQWVQADEAYFHALAGSGGSPIVFNNRGYSRLLQRQLDAAVADFVSALRARPEFTEARSNLRLAMGLKGDYEAAMKGTSSEDRAQLLNNAGFAAALAGDYPKAEALLAEAMTTRASYYEKASENLILVRKLQAEAHAKP